MFFGGLKVARKLLPPFDIFYINCLALLKGNRIIKLIPKTYKEYCISFGGKITIIEREQDRVVYEPAYYPEGDEKEYKFKAPDIYIAELEEVEVHGGTGLVIARGYVLTDIVANDAENRVKYTSGKIRRGTNKAFYLEVSKDIDNVDTAINLCGLAASNYYHLTFEILSRYAYIKNICITDDVTVLLDEEARKYSQYEDLIHTVLENASIKYVSLCERVHCKKILYPSMNTWMPMNVKRKNDFRISDNLISESAITNIRNATKYLRQEKNDIKLFISRKNTKLSRVINEEEVEELFEKAGYKIICTEDLSYKEQVELFSSASCIVGATGAALTNFVYCNPGTIVGCIIPQKYKFCIYSTIAYFAKCRCLFLDAGIAIKARAISKEQYKVDLAFCQGYIKKLENLMRK